MLSIKYKIIFDLKKVLKELTNLDIIPELEHPGDEAHGDYSTNAAMQVFGFIKNLQVSGDSTKYAAIQFDNPIQLAEKIKTSFETLDNGRLPNYLEKIEVVQPGFINFWLSREVLTGFIREILQDTKSALKEEKIEERKIMVEFAHPNTHKQFHLGHLRTLLIGGSLSRILEIAGNKVFKANYQGDIGPHVAKAIFGVKQIIEKHKMDLADIDTRSVWDKAKLLQDAYIIGNKEYEIHKKEIDEINTALYKNDPSVQERYNITRKWSLEYFSEIYKIFNVSFDRLFFESQVAELGKKIVLNNVGRVFKRDNGAVIFEGQKYGLHTRVFITEAGNPTYEAKDIGLSEKQYEAFPFDLNIHVVASEQTEYFRVVFKALEIINPIFMGREFHLPMGIVNLSSGKMSSRTGEIVTIEELLDTIKTEVHKLVGEGRIEEDQKEETVKKITRAAIVYSFLKVNPSLNLVFDISKSITLDGDSGPYILYTYARIQSVLEKANDLKIEGQEKADYYGLEESSLVRSLYKIQDIVHEAADRFAPNIICNYLYELASKFNLYYQKVPIADSSNPQVSLMRLDVVHAYGNAMKELLALLGLETVDKM